MLFSTYFVSAFFTDLSVTGGTLEISGTVTIYFVGGRKLMTLQAGSGGETQEEADWEGTFELEVNLSTGKEPITESSSIHKFLYIYV